MMAKEPTYIKDLKTGAVVFTDANAYAARKKVLAKQKIEKAIKKDAKRSINSMRSEINGLKKLVSDLLDDRNP